MKKMEVVETFQHGKQTYEQDKTYSFGAGALVRYKSKLKEVVVKNIPKSKKEDKE